MYDFLARKIDSNRFDELLKIIKNGKCVAFTGAGLSKPLKYRKWSEGIIESTESDPTLIELTKISKADASIFSLPEIVDRCKVLLGKKYYEFLENEFGPNYSKREKYDKNLMFIWKSNFKHFITTNFDKSLYDNREYCENIGTYPNDKLKIQNERTLFHLHGRAFIKSDEDRTDLEFYLENIIYGIESFINAYDDKKGNGVIDVFLYDIIKEFSVVFIGFSMSDEDFKAAFSKMTKKWKILVEILNKHPRRIKKSPNLHYIFLEYPEEKFFTEKDEHQKKVREFRKKEKELENIGMCIIGYKKNDIVEHKGLSKVLQTIMDEAPYMKMKEVPELGVQTFDSSSASISEVDI